MLYFPNVVLLIEINKNEVNKTHMIPSSWLNRYAPGFKDLKEDEKQSIQNFLFLWSLYESQVLNCNASVRKIKEKINSIEESLKLKDFKDILNYFIKRYVFENKLNPRFNKLNLRDNNMPELVKKVLLKENNETESTVLALLIIVFRYRNNLFHGIKWSYEIKDQIENFQTANKVLTRILDLHQNV